MIPPRFWFLTALTLAAAVSRIVPHPDNFAPFAAVALFGAATLPGRWSAVVVPFVSLLLGDVLLQVTYDAGWQPNWGFHRGQWVVYACLIPSVLLGFAIRRRRSFATVASATLAGSVFFFLVTNFAVWANGSGVTYPRTLQGLLLCYEAAIPFFRNSLAGDVVYATALFGGLALAESRFPALRPAKAVPSVAVQELS
jgi:hypothetical protein